MSIDCSNKEVTWIGKEDTTFWGELHGCCSFVGLGENKDKFVIGVKKVVFSKKYCSSERNTNKFRMLLLLGKNVW